MATESDYSEGRNEEETELYYIYIILGRLESMLPTTINRLGINQSMFPRRFVYKLIDDRLKESGELAANLATTLFRRLRGETKQRNEIQLVDAFSRQRIGSCGSDGGSGSHSVACPELDEYFHCTLCNVHDFIISLNWHEPILDDHLSKSHERYIKSNLAYLKELVKFRRLLADKSAFKLVPIKESNLDKITSEALSTLNITNSSSPRSIKSSLARRSPESPGPRRRVRFNDTRGHAHKVASDNPRLKKYIKDSHSILAMDSLLFALNMFINEIKRQLSSWSLESTAEMRKSMKLIRTSKRKLRVNRLISMAMDREVSNAVLTNIISNLELMESKYLLNQILVTVYAQDDDRLLKIYKQPHVRTFVNEFIRIHEKELLDMIATQVLEIIFDLTMCEINVLPVELHGSKRDRLSDGPTSKTSSDNYLNFVTSWLNLDKILFGSRDRVSATKQTLNAVEQVNDGTAGVDFNFKSSSRILNQMDNLYELSRHILADIFDQIQSKRHLEYLFQMLHKGIGQCLELISEQLVKHLDSFKEALNAQQGNTSRMIRGARHQDSSNADRIVIKIRYLKLIHICSSMDNLIKELSQKGSIIDSMIDSSNISRLVDESTRLMESI